MPQKMMDILQYVPYALLLAFSISLLGIGGLYTFLFFRKADQRLAKESVSSRKN
jgi:hypothetical protein